jgi:hypothetical protein
LELTILIIGYTLDEVVDTALQEHLDVKFEVIAEVEVELVDEGTQYALEEAIYGEYRKARKVVKDAGASLHSALSDLRFVES